MTKRLQKQINRKQVSYTETYILKLLALQRKRAKMALDVTNTQAIPKMFHFIWVGTNPLPMEYQVYINMWVNMYPDWTVTLWRDNNVENFMKDDLTYGAKMINQEQYRSTSVGAQKCDILRVELLYHFGGVYVDCDFEPKKRIDPLIQGDVRAFAATEGYGIISSGIMGSVPKHQAFKDLIDAIPESMRTRKGVGINGVTGPGFNTPILQRHKDLVVFPREMFYPYYFTEKERANEEYPEAYAIHHWGHSWASAVQT